MSAPARVQLTRDGVLEVAAALVVQGGTDGLSMRRLGEALGASTMAAYRHFPEGRDEIIAAMFDTAMVVSLHPLVTIADMVIEAADNLARYPGLCEAPRPGLGRWEHVQSWDARVHERAVGDRGLAEPTAAKVTLAVWGILRMVARDRPAFPDDVVRALVGAVQDTIR